MHRGVAMHCGSFDAPRCGVHVFGLIEMCCDSCVCIGVNYRECHSICITKKQFELLKPVYVVLVCWQCAI